MGVEYVLVRCDHNPIIAFDLGKRWDDFNPKFIEDPALLLAHLQELKEFERDYFLLLRDRILDFADGSKQIELQSDSYEGEWLQAVETHDLCADEEEISNYAGFMYTRVAEYHYRPLDVFRLALQLGIARKKGKRIPINGRSSAIRP